MACDDHRDCLLCTRAALLWAIMNPPRMSSRNTWQALKALLAGTFERVMGTHADMQDHAGTLRAHLLPRRHPAAEDYNRLQDQQREDRVLPRLRRGIIIAESEPTSCLPRLGIGTVAAKRHRPRSSRMDVRSVNLPPRCSTIPLLYLQAPSGMGISIFTEGLVPLCPIGQVGMLEERAPPTPAKP